MPIVKNKNGTVSGKINENQFVLLPTVLQCIIIIIIFFVTPAIVTKSRDVNNFKLL